MILIIRADVSKGEGKRSVHHPFPRQIRHCRLARVSTVVAVPHVTPPFGTCALVPRVRPVSAGNLPVNGRTVNFDFLFGIYARVVGVNRARYRRPDDLRPEPRTGSGETCHRCAMRKYLFQHGNSRGVYYPANRSSRICHGLRALLHAPSNKCRVLRGNVSIGIVYGAAARTNLYWRVRHATRYGR